MRCVTDSALSAILRKLPEEGMGSSRRASGRAVKADASTMTMSGPVFYKIDLPLTGRSMFSWDVVSPSALLNRFCTFSNAFSDAMVNLSQGLALGHLDLVLYTDEAAPGNLLRRLFNCRRINNLREPLQSNNLRKALNLHGVLVHKLMSHTIAPNKF